VFSSSKLCFFSSACVTAHRSDKCHKDYFSCIEELRPASTTNTMCLKVGSCIEPASRQGASRIDPTKISRYENQRVQGFPAGARALAFSQSIQEVEHSASSDGSDILKPAGGEALQLANRRTGSLSNPMVFPTVSVYNPKPFIKSTVYRNMFSRPHHRIALVQQHCDPDSLLRALQPAVSQYL
jgi:hypothetical protein